MGMGLLGSSSRATSVDRHSSNSHLSHLKEFRLNHPLLRGNFDNFTQHMGKFPEDEDFKKLAKSFRFIAKTRHRGAFGYLASYRGYAQHSGLSELKLSDDSTWYSCFESFRVLLQRNAKSDFDLLITFGSSPKAIQETFTFIQKLTPSNHTRLVEAVNTIRRLVILEATLEWNLSPNDIDEISELLDQRKPQRTAWKARLPSQQACPEYGPLIIRRHMFTFRFPSEDTIEPFATDLRVYVFRPYGRAPRIENLNISLFHHQSKQSRKILVIAQKPQIFGDLSKAETWHSQLVEIVEVAVSHTRGSYLEFVRKASEERNQMKPEGRLYPSGSKLQHMLHLKDCLKAALSTCETNLEILSRLLEFLRGGLDDPIALQYAERLHAIEALSEDLKYFAGEVESFSIDIDQIRSTTREQLDLVQMRRTTVFTLFAGLYVPMSFVTSFFGMNLNQSEPWEYSRTNYTYVDPVTNDTLGRNSTITATDSGNRSFSLSLYWAIAVPLTFGTILFPLLCGVFLRWSLQMVSKSRLWWRLVVAFVGLIFLYTSALGAPWFPLSWICLGLFGITFLWQLTNATLRKNWVAVGYWLVMIAVLSGITYPGWLLMWEWSASINLSYHAGPLYWLLLGLGWWLKPDWYYRWDEKRPKSKTL